MADKDTGKVKQWSDREKLVYLYALMEASSTGSFNYNACPKPAGRTLVACQLMVGRLKNALKDDLEALKAGDPIAAEDGVPKGVRTPKTPKTPKTPSKRKTKGAEEDGSPKKRGRPAAKKKILDADEDEAKVETEPVVKEELQEDLDFDLDDGL
ncbi:hypothetical protein K491DRAFT_778326 [Lophiostoma macrostomum CBS 122681]|uniref:Uncharacterized protein n=1 Tax=Lophiostoma macrostomum CBS 122681 TaxID=1314788 RepID=A0A6A6T9Z1_9PLEO|nr:hypothetical protein K491DRAFT_778326 [Lophiostoma macrostomum CBS 122681]